MQPKGSPLNLLGHRFHAFECEASEEEDPKGVLSLTTSPFHRRIDGEKLQWAVGLEVKFGPGDPEKPAAYHGLIRVSGNFEIHESFPEENREALLQVTAASILYGACRELLANFTARSVHGILSLPSISFRAGAKDDKPDGPKDTETAKKDT